MSITKAPPYQQVFDRIRTEYREMPGMRLTAEQLSRLSGVHASVCIQVLNDLVRAQFLRVTANGSYGKLERTAGSTTRAGSTCGSGRPLRPVKSSEAIG
jgi:hypothetical protein